MTDLAGRVAEGLDQDGLDRRGPRRRPWTWRATWLRSVLRRLSLLELALGSRSQSTTPGSSASRPATSRRRAPRLSIPSSCGPRTRLPTSPERHHRGLALGPGDDDLVGLDRLDPPGRGAEDERLADPALEDELLVQLPQPRPVLAEVTWDTGRCRGSSRRRSGPASPSPGRGVEPVPDPVPAHPGLEVAEGRDREPAGDHLQDPFERLRGREVAVGVRPIGRGRRGRGRPRARPPRTRRPAGRGRRGSWSAPGASRPRWRPSPGPGPPTRAGRPWVLANIRPLLTRPTTCPARPTRWSPRATPTGRADLADQVDRPHVDPQLERRRRDHARQLARASGQLLALAPLLLAQAAVVGSGERSAAGRRGRHRAILGLGQLVEPCDGQPLDDPPVVGEDDRRSVRRGSAPGA